MKTLVAAQRHRAAHANAAEKSALILSAALFWRPPTTAV
jgi:hypothetical protein